MQRKLNILIVTDAFYPDSIGGTEKVIYQQAKYLSANGHNVYILVRKGSKGILDREIKDDIKIIRYSDNFRTFGVFYISSLISVWKAFLKLSKEVNFDIIHFHHSLTAFGILFFAKTYTIKKVFHFHGPAHLEFEFEAKTQKKFLYKLWMPIKSYLLKFFERYTLKRSDAVVVLSEYSKKLINQIYGDFNINIIPSGVKPINTDDKKQLREILKLPQDKYILITVRRLVARMGIEKLIEAFSIIEKSSNDFFLVVVGDGYLKERLENMAKKLKIKDILFTGFVKGELIYRYFSSADLSILPSLALEGFGLSTVESLGCGTPVLGTKIGGTSEILAKFDEDFLIDDANPEVIAKWILSNFKNKCLNISQRCVKFVRNNYPEEKMGNKIEQLYFELLNKN